MNWNWLTSTEFWTAFIAAIALIFSQFPPIKQMIKGKRLRWAVADRIGLTHVSGNTNMSIWLDLENVGGRTITIRKIACLVLRGQVKVQTLIAKTYWLTESLSRNKEVEIPISEIVLKPGDRWSGYLHFWDTQSWTQDIQSKISSLTTKIKDDIETKLSERANLHPEIPSSELVEAGEELVREFTNLTKTLYKIEIGDYELLFTAHEDFSAPPLRLSGFNITVYEKDSRDIYKDADDYKYGYGVYLTTRKKAWVYFEARAMDGNAALKRLSNFG